MIMWPLKIAVLPTLLAISVSGWPIRVNNPTAVTTPATSINPTQLAYYLQNYPNELPTRFTQPQAYLPDPDYIKSSQPQDTTKPVTTTSDSDYYFVPTIKPYPKQTEGYDFYFPQPEDNVSDDKDPKDSYLYELQPPKQTSESNYYAVKPKKGTKKYNSQKKQINHTGSAKDTRPVAGIGMATGADGADVEYNYDDYFGPNSESAQASHSNLFVHEPPVERLTPKAAIRTLRQEELNIGEYLPSILRNGNDDNERVEFQMHGFNGPKSYKFGFDTGKGENRQFRVEHRDKEGNVEGQYGYFDSRGKMNVVKYTSKGDEGFKAEQLTK